MLEIHINGYGLVGTFQAAHILDPVYNGPLGHSLGLEGWELRSRVGTVWKNKTSQTILDPDYFMEIQRPQAGGRMQDNFKSIQHAPPENGVVWICHVDDIKCDVFCAKVLGSAKGYQ
jgi:hypothetical protein